MEGEEEKEGGKEEAEAKAREGALIGDAEAGGEG